MGKKCRDELMDLPKFSAKTVSKIKAIYVNYLSWVALISTMVIVYLFYISLIYCFETSSIDVTSCKMLDMIHTGLLVIQYYIFK
jgi:hypothetical protein